MPAMQVIEAQRASILVPHHHLHDNPEADLGRWVIHVVASTSGLSTEQMFIGIGVTTCEGKVRSRSALGAVVLTRNDRTAGFYGRNRTRSGSSGVHSGVDSGHDRVRCGAGKLSAASCAGARSLES